MLLFKIISQFKLRIFSSEGKNYFLRCNRYENIKLQTYQSVTLSVSSIFKNNLNVTLYRKFCTLLFIKLRFFGLFEFCHDSVANANERNSFHNNNLTITFFNFLVQSIMN